MQNKHLIYFSFFLYIFFSLIFNLHIPAIWPDEVLFFNPSYELGINGVMRTSVLTGLIPGMENYTLWMPPVFMVLLSGIFQIFPADLLTARLFSSCVSLASLFLIYRLCFLFSFTMRRTAWVLFLLATDFAFLKFSHTSRMESLCFFFALLSFYFLLKGKNFNSSKKDLDIEQDSSLKNLDVFWAGVFLSLSFLSHPFGIVHSVPVLFLLYQRNGITIKNIFICSVGGLIPLAAWGYYIIPNFDLFVTQFGAQLSRKNELLGKFTIIEKVKIIFSAYKYPLIKLGLFILTVALFLYSIFKQRTSNHLSFKNFYNFSKSSNEIFFLIWLLTIVLFLFLSSEFWYVFHMVVPFFLVLSYLLDQNLKASKFVGYVSVAYNFIIIFWIVFGVFFIYKSPEKTNEFFQLIEKEVERHNNIYLQAIPDPYFYLRNKFPNKNLSEFIPGELSGTKNEDIQTNQNDLFGRFLIWKKSYKIDENYYKAAIEKQDVFVFYNENLMNGYIRKHLEKNADKFERKVILVDTPKGSDLKLEAVLFLRK